MFYEEGFAIVGIGCRFPGGINSLDSLWDVLAKGEDVVTEVPAERFDIKRYWHPDRSAPGRTCTVSAGIAGDVTQFDAAFFGMSQKEVEALDPQQRMVLEMTWEAFEDAGIKPSSMAGTKTAVYMGAASTDMGIAHSDDLCATGPYGMTGTSLSIIANRVSYFFDLHGPSMTIDTACSSSLVALHEACRSMQAEGLPMAVVGGVNVLLSPVAFVGFSKAHMLSADGRCKVFDADGNGYVRAEGGAVLLIKPLQAARAAGDRIHAVIRATAVNSDGRTAGIALPNGAAQAALMRSIYDDPRVDRSRVAYLEAHGTGTAVGDPIETGAIGAVLGRRSGEPLPIGSVKANVGHMETASGMAGLAKTMLVLEKGEIPANALLKTPNPKIDFSGLGLEAPVSLRKLPDVKGEPMAGVNSFGFGGTNAHVLLERSERAGDEVTAKLQNPLNGWLYPLLLSAKSMESLQALAAAYAEKLRGLGSDEADALCCAAANERELLPVRLLLWAKTPEKMAADLAQFAADGEFSPEADAAAERETVAGGRTAFIYSGNGSQWAGMGASLYQQEPAFAEAVDAVDERFKPLAGWSLVEQMMAPAESWHLDRTEIAQPMLFAVQVGLTALMSAYGVRAERFAGHSVGEVAAAWAAGALTLDDAVRVIYERSALQGRTFGSGVMAAAKLPEQQLARLLEACPQVEIAGFNAPENYTLSGDEAQIDALGPKIKAAGGLFKKLPLRYAFHSTRMTGLEEDVKTSLAGIRPQAVPAGKAFVSSVTGGAAEDSSLGAAYWWKNIREPVRFGDAVAALLKDGVTRFLEIGPHAILTGYVRAAAKAADANIKTLRTMTRGEEETAWRRALPGIMASWPLTDFWPAVPRRRDLPHYPWNKKRCWPAMTPESHQLFAPLARHPLLGVKLPKTTLEWENALDLQLSPWLAGHEIDETVLFPAAGYIEVARAAGAAAMEAQGSAHSALEIDHLAILRPLVLQASPAQRVRTSVSGDGVLLLASRAEMSEDMPVVHARARVTPTDAPVPAERHFERAVQKLRVLDPQSLYEALAALGLRYQGAFKPIDAAWQLDEQASDGEAAVLVHLTSRDAAADAEEGLPPALVDGALQGIFFLLAQKAAQTGSETAAYLPSWFGRTVVWHQGAPAWGVIRLKRLTARSASAVFELYDKAGRALARLEDVRYLRVHHKSKALDPMVYSEAWVQEAELPADGADAAKRAFEEILSQECRRLSLQQELPEEYGFFANALPLSVAYEAARMKGEWVPVESVFQDGFSPKLEKFNLAMAAALVRNDLAEYDGGLIRVRPQDSLANPPPPADVLCRTILAAAPSAWPELLAIADVSRSFAKLIAGERTLDEVLGRDAKGLWSARMMRMPARAAYETALAAMLAKAAERTAAQGALLRVLVVVRHGGESLDVMLRALGARADVTLCAAEEKTAAHLAARFERTPGVTVLPLKALLDAASDEQAAGSSSDGSRRFDLALAPEGLSFADDVSAVLGCCCRLLKPSGSFALLELSPALRYDFIAGADERWWKSGSAASDDDEALAAPVSELAGESSWISAVRAAGFGSVESASAEWAPDQFALFASRPSVKADGQAASAAVPAARQPVCRLLLAETCSRASSAADRLDKLEAALSGAGFELSVLREEDALSGLKTRFESLEAGEPLFIACAGEGFICGGAEAERSMTPPIETLKFLQTLQQLMQAAPADGKARPVSLALLLADPARPEAAAVNAMARTARNECPGLMLRTIALADDEEASYGAAAAALEEGFSAAVQPAGGEAEERIADEVMIRRGRSAQRRVCAEPLGSYADAGAVRQGVEDDARRASGLRLAFDMPGKLDRLVWKPFEAAPLAPDEIRIETRATGLNFRDVMWAMGMLPDEALENGFSGPTMGLEASGVVTAVGGQVTQFRPGDEVVAFAPSCFSTTITTKEGATAKKPANLTFAQAASVPVAFFTAWYAISHLGRAQPGERILIHGAAGGVGLAAIQIAAVLGLEVYATAGSDEKRGLLADLGIKHIYSSRSLAFADEILRDTNGRGVDLVLNSLAGDGAEKSLQVLAPFGRFLELGKRDFYADSPMYLRPFRMNLSYFGIDVDQLLIAKPALAKTLFEEVLNRFEKGDFCALPVAAYPAERAAEAFQAMQASRHVGKLVVTYPPHAAEDLAPKPVGLPPLTAPAPQIDFAAGTWLITGGLGGLGSQAARRLAAAGVKHLVLLSRRGAAGAAAQALVGELEAQGVDVRTPAIDMADEAFDARLDQALAGLPALAGVIHAAGVIADARLADLTPEAMTAVWAPKAKGAAALDRYVSERGIRLSAFVCFSSATVLLGNPGQANYVAANAAVEAICAERRARGEAAVVIGWGPVGDVGMLRSNEQARKILETTLGTPPLSSAAVLDAMMTLLRADVPASHFFAIDWQRVRGLPTASSSRFSRIWKAVGQPEADASTLADELAGKTPEEAVDLLTELVTKEAAKLMGMPAADLNVHQPVADIGMDSLMVVELAVALEERIGVKIPAVSLSGGATIRTIAERFYQMLCGSRSEGENALDTMAEQHGVKLSEDVKSEILNEMSGRKTLMNNTMTEHTSGAQADRQAGGEQ